MIQVTAYQLAESINIRGIKKEIAEHIHFSDGDEIFFEPFPKKLVYVFKYGVACLLNFDEENASHFLHQFNPYLNNPLIKPLTEEFSVETHAEKIKFGYDKIRIVQVDSETLRVIMFNVAQSVAMDYYMQQTEMILEETAKYTYSLEKKGKLGISGKYLRQFIGKTLNLKNGIEKNLYIFDSPKITWENEDLDLINSGLKNTFELQTRYKTINQGLQAIKENLDLFKDLMQYNKSNLLEWIVIALFLVEILNVIFEKLKS